MGWFLLILMVALVAVVGWMTHTLRTSGLPQWAQVRVLAELERSGVTVHCDRLWWDTKRGAVVAEKVMFAIRGGMNVSGQAQELTITAKPMNWFRREPVVQGIRFTEAQMTVTLPQSDVQARIEHASARGRLASDGAIDLDELTAEVLGVQLKASGYLIPPRVMPKLDLPSTSTPGNDHLFARVVRAIQEAKFARKPELTIEFGGDLSDPKSGSIRAEFTCGGVEYEEWAVESVAMIARLEEKAVALEKFDAKLYGGKASMNGRYDLISNSFEAHLKSDVDIKRFASVLPETWAKELSHVKYAANPRLDVAVRTEPLAPLDRKVSGRVEVDGFTFKGVNSKGLSADVTLEGPWLRAKNVLVVMAEGELRGEYEGRLDTREFAANAESSIDVKQIIPLVPPRDRPFFTQFKFGPPPHIIGTARGTWGKPEATVATGKVALKNFIFRGIPLDEFTADVKIEKETATLTNALAKRPEGEARGNYRAGLRNNLFTVDFVSTIDPHAVKPAFDDNVDRFIDRFEFEKPPRIAGRMSGHFRDVHQLHWDGTVECSHPFQINGVKFTGGSTQQSHANDHSIFTDFRLTRAEGEIRGAGEYDFPRQQTTLKNVVSTVDPHETARVFGEKSVKTIEPYQFREPPTLVWNGLLDSRDHANDDLRVKIEGKGFHYWKFTADEVKTDLSIKEQVLTLKEFDAAIYGGRLTGEASFEIGKTPMPFRADVRLQKSDLQKITSAMTGNPSKVEGQLTARMNFSATSAGAETIVGEGKTRVEDGLLWDAPIFGVVSRAVGKVFPGLGYLRATRAEMTFTCADGKLLTDNLEIDAGMTRLGYRGAYAFRDSLDFKVQAHVLGNTPLSIIGFFFKPLTKLFEFHVGGSLGEPKLRPLYLPKEIFGQ